MRKNKSFTILFLFFILSLICQPLFSLSKWISFSDELYYVPDLTRIEEQELPPTYNILETDLVENVDIVEIDGVLYVVELE